MKIIWPLHTYRTADGHDFLLLSRTWEEDSLFRVFWIVAHTHKDHQESELGTLEFVK